jgi:hypothetical protein
MNLPLINFNVLGIFCCVNARLNMKYLYIRTCIPFVYAKTLWLPAKNKKKTNYEVHICKELHCLNFYCLQHLRDLFYLLLSQSFS